MGVHFSISVVMLSTFIYAVNYAEDNFEFEKDEIISLLPQESLGSNTELTQQALDQVAEKPQLLLESAVMFLILLVNDFDKFALALWAVNEIMDGFYMNLATIFLIEEIEVGGLFIIFHIFGRKIQQT